MKIKTISLIGLTALLAACATAPENITPQFVSSVQYQGLTCEQLGMELSRHEEALAVASGQQKKARSNDTMGIIFLGLPVSTLSGSNKASYIAHLKGQIEAMNKVTTTKNCNS